MRIETIDLWLEDEYSYPMAFGFMPSLTNYLHDDGKDRDFVVVAPGGGYELVSPTEGKIVAEEFYNKGYDVGVLTYTTDFLHVEPLEMQPLKDISRAVRNIRKNNTNSKIAICGFSAGGHLCASLAVHFADIEDENLEYRELSNRPDACILAYPVITSGKYAHQGSFKNLIGATAYDDVNLREKLEYFSLEKQVSENTPPCFLWHTVTDTAVPVENSLLFVQALRDKEVNVGLHIYSKGPHGLSLSNEKWASGDFGEPYTLKQNFNIIEALKKGDIQMESSDKEMFINKFKEIECEGDNKKREPIKEVASWIGLAFDWLDENL